MFQVSANVQKEKNQTLLYFEFFSFLRNLLVQKGIYSNEHRDQISARERKVSFSFENFIGRFLKQESFEIVQKGLQQIAHEIRDLFADFSQSHGKICFLTPPIAEIFSGMMKIKIRFSLLFSSPNFGVDTRPWNLLEKDYPLEISKISIPFSWDCSYCSRKFSKSLLGEIFLDDEELKKFRCRSCNERIGNFHAEFSKIYLQTLLRLKRRDPLFKGIWNFLSEKNSNLPALSFSEDFLEKFCQLQSLDENFQKHFLSERKIENENLYECFLFDFSKFLTEGIYWNFFFSLHPYFRHPNAKQFFFFEFDRQTKCVLFYIQKGYLAFFEKKFLVPKTCSICHNQIHFRENLSDLCLLCEKESNFLRNLLIYVEKKIFQKDQKAYLEGQTLQFQKSLENELIKIKTKTLSRIFQKC